MATFPDLLRLTTAHCNRRGKQLAISVLLFGSVSILLWILTSQSIISEGTRQLTALLGPEAVTRIEQKIEGMAGRPDGEAMVNVFRQELNAKLGDIPRDEKIAILINVGIRGSIAALPTIGLGVLLIAFCTLWSWAFWLVLGAGSEASWWTMMTQALRLMPRLLALIILLFCITVLWIPVVAVAVGIVVPVVLPVLLVAEIVFAGYLWPRLLLSPMILAQDRTTVINAIRRSIKLSKRRWFRIVGNIIGVGAVVWLGTFIARILLNMLVQVALPVSPYAVFLWQVLTYILLIGSAYRTVFAMRLKEELSS